VSELTTEYGVHPIMIHQWKKALLEGAADIFERGGKKKAAEVDEETVWELQAKIAELAAANDFCQGSSSLGPASEAADDRTRPSGHVDRGTVPPAIDLSVVVRAVVQHPLKTDAGHGDERHTPTLRRIHRHW